MELTYHRKGDYLFPNLYIESEPSEPIGKYGILRKAYLKEHRSGWYQSMLATGKLSRHLSEIDQTAQRRVDQIVAQLQARNTAPDKEIDPLGWAAHMNSLLATAEEIVLSELIYQ